MKIERMLQVNVAVLTVLGALLLGLGQDNPMLPTLSLFAAVTSIYFTDMMGWFRLHRAIANLAAVGALFISMREFDIFGGDSTSQLHAIASLLVYLQFVLLYQEKNQRVYWQLVVLSLLQVVVAAALELGVEFGALLIGYMFTAVSAMSLLFVHHHVEAVQEARRRMESAPAPAAASVWAPTAIPLTSRQCSESEIAEALLGWPFFRRLLATGTATLVLAVIVFYATPRLGDNVWRGTQHARTVGFSPEIRLGEMGELLQSERRALRLTLLDSHGRPFVLREPPYIRGAVLTEYAFDGVDARWGPGESHGSARLEPLEDPPEGQPSVTMQFVLEPSHSPLLFSIVPTYRTERTPPDLHYDAREEQLRFRPRASLPRRSAEFRYEAATTAIVGNRQLMLCSKRESNWEDLQGELQQRHLRRLPRRLQHVPRLAREIVEEAGAAHGGPYEIAMALTSHFHERGRYAYTLDQSDAPPLPLGMDPVEHFLVNHRRG
ncbi:MAG: DUF3488 domain-containing protein, partial [Planctomycetes bacterium]|nr:DUF3488 domain-containing protein [Planctomycetota bacterium]